MSWLTLANPGHLDVFECLPRKALLAPSQNSACSRPYPQLVSPIPTLKYQSRVSGLLHASRRSVIFLIFSLSLSTSLFQPGPLPLRAWPRHMPLEAEVVEEGTGLIHGRDAISLSDLARGVDYYRSIECAQPLWVWPFCTLTGVGSLKPCQEERRQLVISNPC